MAIVKDVLLECGKRVSSLRIHESVFEQHKEYSQAILLDKSTVEMLQTVNKELDVAAYSWDMLLLDAAIALQRQTKQHRAHRAMIDRTIGK